MSALLSIDRLRVELPAAKKGMRTVIHDVSLDVQAGEAVGLVGESGSGKSMTTRAVMRLLPEGARLSGEIRFDGISIPGMDRRALRRWRATRVGMIFQDPRAHINPVRTIGDFLFEGVMLDGRLSTSQARERISHLMRAVGIADVDRRLNQYPHELSGGLLQRVMIAAALTTEPELLLADEPTTALDVTTQEEVIAIIDELRRERGLAMLFITHDLDLAAAVCGRIAVMYAGSIVEEQKADALGLATSHPYTKGLLAARPELGRRERRLQTIEGRPISAFEVGDGCAFATRCPRVRDRCRQERPAPTQVPGGRVACHFIDFIDAAAGSPAVGSGGGTR
ncbi:ABC transporter ATP-binding protein [Microtetraspora sp. NBRC 16547]|uniref:ABC transporter ATP-binding protein n=1 Tax=Microtetraspora sp. NBRC 16547 TaxID=3030993 RepID=UPI0024A2C969|nr:ABC transporter ATP-binding protein [Microtetraspora sp. NBRC 16547]GLW96764.1 peptide ABC transporter ATP-binding protein [Microtetraspora sp. NBRC 16547]